MTSYGMCRCRTRAVKTKNIGTRLQLAKKRTGKIYRYDVISPNIVRGKNTIFLYKAANIENEKKNRIGR